MWRAVVAMAHADGVLQAEEEEMIRGYLESVPFTSSQKEIVTSDLHNPQDPARMFDAITEPEDRGQFFEFARMLLWSDGDYDAQEEAIFEKLKGSQMAGLDLGGLKSAVESSREAASVERLQQDMDFRDDAKQRLSFGAALKNFIKRPKEE